MRFYFNLTKIPPKLLNELDQSYCKCKEMIDYLNPNSGDRSSFVKDAERILSINHQPILIKKSKTNEQNYLDHVEHKMGKFGDVDKAFLDVIINHFHQGAGNNLTWMVDSFLSNISGEVAMKPIQETGSINLIPQNSTNAQIHYSSSSQLISTNGILTGGNIAICQAVYSFLYNQQAKNTTIKLQHISITIRTEPVITNSKTSITPITKKGMDAMILKITNKVASSNSTNEFDYQVLFNIFENKNLKTSNKQSARIKNLDPEQLVVFLMFIAKSQYKIEKFEEILSSVEKIINTIANLIAKNKNKLNAFSIESLKLINKVTQTHLGIADKKHFQDLITDFLTIEMYSPLALYCLRKLASDKMSEASLNYEKNKTQHAHALNVIFKLTNLNNKKEEVSDRLFSDSIFAEVIDLCTNTKKEINPMLLMPLQLIIIDFHKNHSKNTTTQESNKKYQNMLDNITVILSHSSINQEQLTNISEAIIAANKDQCKISTNDLNNLIAARQENKTITHDNFFITQNARKILSSSNKEPHSPAKPNPRI